jgi:hypothetical protein
MTGSESLASIAWLHGAAQIVGVLLLGLLGVAAVAAYLHLPRGNWPATVEVPGFPLRTRWFAIERLRLSSRSLEIATLAAIGVLIIVLVTALALGRHKETLLVSVGQARAEKVSVQAVRLQQQGKEIAALQRRHQDLETRRDADAARSAAQIARLQSEVKDANEQFVEFQRGLGQKRLTRDEKQALVAALKPFSGQKVTVASIVGDAEGKLLAEDFVAVFDQAGWDHYGEAGITAQQWDRDPVGVEVTLNEDDARAGRISSGVGALINAVRKLGLTRDNTVYMNGKVPVGEVQLKVGRKLSK